MRLLTFTGLLLLLSFNYPSSLHAQSMQSLFLRLPESCTPGLNKSEKKSLVNEGEYMVNTSHSAKSANHPVHPKHTAIDYSIDTITDNYLSYEYSNSNGDGSYASYEIKRFKTTTGKSILLFSKNSDTKATNDKFDLKIYIVTDTSLIESKEHFLPEKMDYSVFLKNSTPDSVKTYIKKTSLCTFDLDLDASDKIISYIVLGSDKDEKWLTGDIMELKWTGKAFTGAVSFQKDKEETGTFHSTWQAK